VEGLGQIEASTHVRPATWHVYSASKIGKVFWTEKGHQQHCVSHARHSQLEPPIPTTSNSHAKTEQQQMHQPCSVE
jgi:hypothetical protein